MRQEARGHRDEDAPPILPTYCTCKTPRLEDNGLSVDILRVFVVVLSVFVVILRCFCGNFTCLCDCFVFLCSGFASLCLGFASLYGGFASLCGCFVSHCGCFLGLVWSLYISMVVLTICSCDNLCISVFDWTFCVSLQL